MDDTVYVLARWVIPIVPNLQGVGRGTYLHVICWVPYLSLWIGVLVGIGMGINEDT